MSKADIRHKAKSLNASAQQLNLFSELLSDGYDLRLKVTGASMSPFLKTGSFVTLSKIPVSKLRIGDIIYCKCRDGSFKLHRLIQIKKDVLITKGDALASYDVPFKKTDYKARVVRIEHCIGNGMIRRNKKNHSSRIVNYLIAKYYHTKLSFLRISIRLKLKNIKPA